MERQAEYKADETHDVITAIFKEYEPENRDEMQKIVDACETLDLAYDVHSSSYYDHEEQERVRSYGMRVYISGYLRKALS